MSDRDTEDWSLQAEMDARWDESEDARRHDMWDTLGEDQ